MKTARSILLCALLSSASIVLAQAPVFPGVQFQTGAAWNSSTSLNTLQYPTGTTTENVLNGAPAVLVQLDQTTTLTAGVVTFQGTFDNTNWVTIPVVQVLNPNTFAQLTNPYTFVASTNQPFLILTQGYVAIRANLTTAITGTGSVTPYWSTQASLPVLVNPPTVSPCNILTTASTNSTSCKASAGNFLGYEIYNTTTTVYYLRLYNASSAPTCSSSTGFIRSIPIPPAASSGLVGGAVAYPHVAVPYGTGIGYCITGGSGSTDNTNAAAGVFGEIKYE